MYQKFKNTSETSDYRRHVIWTGRVPGAKTIPFEGDILLSVPHMRVTYYWSVAASKWLLQVANTLLLVVTGSSVLTSASVVNSLLQCLVLPTTCSQRAISYELHSHSVLYCTRVRWMSIVYCSSRQPIVKGAPVSSSRIETKSCQISAQYIWYFTKQK